MVRRWGITFNLPKWIDARSNHGVTDAYKGCSNKSQPRLMASPYNCQGEKAAPECSVTKCPKVGLGNPTISWFSSRALVQLIMVWKTWPWPWVFCILDHWIVRLGKQSQLVSEVWVFARGLIIRQRRTWPLNGQLATKGKAEPKSFPGSGFQGFCHHGGHNVDSCFLMIWARTETLGRDYRGACWKTSRCWPGKKGKKRILSRRHSTGKRPGLGEHCTF